MNPLWVSLTITTLAITHISYCTATSETLCNNIEKQSLLSFKAFLVDPSNRLASWVGGEDCCHWAGVVCHNLTGHVLELHLGGDATYPILDDDDDDYDYNYDNEVSAYERSCLGGKISISLLDLRHRRYLDLSNNDFGGSRIPEFFGSMQSLRLRNLSSSGFGGMVPPQLGNLSNLLYLNIGHGDNIYVENLDWLSGFYMLKHLDMNYVNLSYISNLVQQISAFPSLKELHLQDCELGNVALFPNMNFSSLEILDISHNARISSYSFLEMFHYLVSLDVSDNWISGQLPSAMQNLTLARDLILSYNGFNSSLPNWIYNLRQLEKLMLGGNEDLQGVLFDGIGNLSALTHLDLSGINLGQELTHLFEKALKSSFGGLQYLSMSL